MIYENWREIGAELSLKAGITSKVDRFFFLRHGQTDHNAGGIVQGWTDIPLNATGLDQARLAGEILKGRGITHIIASPLSRALKTAQIVGQALNLDVSATDERLREKNFGGYENQPDPVPTVWSRQDKNAEPYADFANRVTSGISAALQSGGVPLIVAHGGCRRILLWALELESDAWGNAVPMEFNRNAGQWSLQNLQEGNRIGSE